MKRIYILVFTIFTSLMVLPQLSQSQDVLIHYWNFNDIPNDTDFSTTDPELLGVQSLIPGASLEYNGARWDRVNDPTSLNAREDPYVEDDDRALRLRNPTGDFTLNLPTTGYENVVFRYAVSRSTNGAEEQVVSYSVDGQNFVTTGLENNSIDVNTDFDLIELDLSDIPEVNDNPDFRIRVTATGPGSGPENDSGNQRVNHVSLDGDEIEEDAFADLDLIHYWNFNDIPNNEDFPIGEPIVLDVQSETFGAFLQYDGARWDRVNDPTELNARENPYKADDDRALRLRNPTGPFTITAPTTGYNQIVVKYALTRTSNGAVSKEISYSVDGENYITDGLETTEFDVSEEYILYTFDLSDLPDVENNENFRFRILATGEGSESGNNSGNHRINHISIDGNQIETTSSEPIAEVPGAVELDQNYPNPFNPSTVIPYRLNEASHVTLELFDMTGRRVAVLVDRQQTAGLHSVSFDASNLASGIFTYRITAGNEILTRKMTLMK